MRWVEKLLDLLDDGSDVLELGCGGGQWSLWLASHGISRSSAVFMTRNAETFIPSPNLCGTCTDPAGT